MKSLGIACTSGSFKGVFIHGILSAFESINIRANAYAAASSSTLLTACAAIGKALKLIPRLKSGGFRGHRELGIGHWPMHECPLPQDDGRRF
ncbi:hypothetical protein QUB80_18805 [Chlorogloeopsis sp. ULAP01]|uniref:hypothetical protein n=1 Tax=Chlorogloeopsis sp. ULAP01 TaxID=3056483 RepID=UPI0025AAE15A|nr:hypothetical protein [Chlorogloeopsis sp. ULAP01]MDM9382746.1 hypothetical protein [Chlorogloeopsis sp. ULAP01]